MWYQSCTSTTTWHLAKGLYQGVVQYHNIIILYDSLGCTVWWCRCVVSWSLLWLAREPAASYMLLLLVVRRMFLLFLTKPLELKSSRLVFKSLSQQSTVQSIEEAMHKRKTSSGRKSQLQYRHSMASVDLLRLLYMMSSACCLVGRAREIFLWRMRLVSGDLHWISLIYYALTHLFCWRPAAKNGGKYEFLGLSRSSQACKIEVPGRVEHEHDRPWCLCTCRLRCRCSASWHASHVRGTLFLSTWSVLIATHFVLHVLVLPSRQETHCLCSLCTDNIQKLKYNTFLALESPTGSFNWKAWRSLFAFKAMYWKRRTSMYYPD